ncbi:MAG: hypothetical protein V5A55_06875 [Halovenus sp.]
MWVASCSGESAIKKPSSLTVSSGFPSSVPTVMLRFDDDFFSLVEASVLEHAGLIYV